MEVNQIIIHAATKCTGMLGRFCLSPLRAVNCSHAEACLDAAYNVSWHSRSHLLTHCQNTLRGTLAQ